MRIAFARRPLALLVMASLALLSMLAGAASAQPASQALVLTLDGPLTPVLTTYIERGIARAQRTGTSLIILQLNTPGGQITLMEDVVAAIRNSPVPVVVYVAPRGAIAGSAGTVITLAGHVAAMAPETAIGAASPVGGQGENLESTIESKEKEILKATVRSLAARRPPAAIALAEATIESAKAVTATEAHAVGLVDFLAVDLPDLLQQMDGFTVIMEDDRSRTLATASLTATEFPMNTLEAVLNLLTNPNVVFLLLALGAQAILIELSSPGGWVAGFIGVIALALAFYGLGVLPVNWFGLVFVLTAFVLFVLEIKATTHGALATAATACLILGALVLFNSPGSPEFFRVSVPLVVGTSVVVAAGFVFILTFALRALRRPIAVGVESLIGQQGQARGPATVHVAGELWNAETDEGPLEAGQQVEVTGVQGLKLLVRTKKA